MLAPRRTSYRSAARWMMCSGRRQLAATSSARLSRHSPSAMCQVGSRRALPAPANAVLSQL